MSKDTKKFISFVLVLCLVLTQFVTPGLFADELNSATVSATENSSEVYSLSTIADYTALGVVEGGSSVAYDSADGKVVNFRCNKKAIGGVEYYWLISRGAGSPSSLYLGDDNSFDMSRVTKVTIDYLSNKNTDTTKKTVISLSKDKEGTQVVATAQVPYPNNDNMTAHHTLEINVTDVSYKGPLYLYMNPEVRIFVGNLQITMDPAATEAPATEAPAASLKDQLGGYIYTKDMIMNTHFSKSNGMAKTKSGGGSGEMAYFTLARGKSAASYVTFTFQDTDAITGLNLNEYPVLVAKVQLDRKFIGDETGYFGVEINGGNRIENATLIQSTTEWQLLILDLSSANVDSLSTMKLHYITNSDATEYLKTTWDYFAFFSADADLSSFDGDLASLLAGDTPETEPPATEAPATEAPATEAPATEAPATEAPATEAPATEAPADPIPGESADNRLDINAMESTVTVAPGKTIYLRSYRLGGTVVTITGAGAFAVDYNGTAIVPADGAASFAAQGNMFNPDLFAITNNTDADVEYTIKAVYPVGSMMNPDTFDPAGTNVTIDAGNAEGYFYKYIATKDGIFTIEFFNNGENQVDVTIMNNNSYAQKKLLEEGVDGKLSIPVTAGDELIITVAALPTETWEYPAVSASIKEYIEPGSSADNRLDINAMESTVTVAPGKTIYLQSYRLGGTVVTITGAGAFAVDYNGTAIVPADGAASFAAQGNMF
ncbi:MAG: hypothetical protein E7385_08705, partial [Ruminococcaceae bacterium]|nr:hypothetical protein [Oscillospiraceae bacterium]